MRLEVIQDLVIVGGSALLMWSGVVAKEPLNIVLSGVFLLFGIAVLFNDLQRGKHE